MLEDYDSYCAQALRKYGFLADELLRKQKGHHDHIHVGNVR
jgi:hypothetical protein